MPNIPIPALHTYASDGTMEEVSGGTLFRGDALGSWEHLRDQEYAARYKFFIFNPVTGARTLTEVVTSQIELQGRDAFAATAIPTTASQSLSSLLPSRFRGLSFRVPSTTISRARRHRPIDR